MAKVRRERAEGISLYGLLLVLVGGGFLFSALKFRWSELLFGQFGHRFFVLVMAVVTLWGIKEILNARYADTVLEKGVRLRRGSVTVPWQWVFYLAIMSVCFAGSLLGRSNMLMLVFAILVGPFILNGWMAYSILHGTEVRRRAPARVMAGTPAAIEITVENRKRLTSSWLVTVDDQIQNNVEWLETGALFTRVPPRSRRTAHYQLRLMQRGKYTLGPLKLSTRFPLGLVERSRLFDKYDQIIVHPRLGRLSAAWKRARLMAHELVHREDRRHGVFDDEFHGIREYRWGDNPRAIHWRTSARRNELMVREFQQSREQNLIVLLDLWQPAQPAAADLERVELAVSLAATVCVEHMRSGGESELMLVALGAAPTRWEGRSRPRNIEPLLDTLAMVRARSTPDAQPLLQEAAAKRGPGTRAVFLTTRQHLAASSPDGQRHAISRPVEGLNDLYVIQVEEDSIRRFFQLH